MEGDQQYLKDFHWCVTSGLVMDLDHPIGWAVNCWRTPGATFSPEYYQRMLRFIPRFLLEVLEAQNLGKPTVEEVYQWVAEHYEQNPQMNDLFNSVDWEWPDQEEG